jgi:predicted protein tyrosine phosphatase
MTANTKKLWNLPFKLAICGLNELPEMLEEFAPTHVVSILDPGDDRPEFPVSMNVLQMDFWDAHGMTVTSSNSALLEYAGYPSPTHAEAILEFGKTLTKGARVLTHCWAGISRSTAAAYLLACQHRPGEEFQAFEHIKRLRPQAQPNRMLVEFGDRRLGANRRMLHCLG